MIPRIIPKRRLQAIYHKLNEDARGRLVLTMLDVLPITAEQCEVLVDQFNEETDPEKKREIFFKIADLYCGEETTNDANNHTPSNIRTAERRFPERRRWVGSRGVSWVP